MVELKKKIISLLFASAILANTSLPVFADKEKEPEELSNQTEYELMDNSVDAFKTNGNIVITDAAGIIHQKKPGEQTINLYARLDYEKSDTVTILSRKNKIASVSFANNKNTANLINQTQDSVTIRANKAGSTYVDIIYDDKTKQRIYINVKKYVEMTKTLSSNIETGGSDVLTIDGDDENCEIQKRNGKYAIRIENEDAINYTISDTNIKISPKNGSVGETKVYVAFENEIKVVTITNAIQQSRIMKEGSSITETHTCNIPKDAYILAGDCVRLKEKTGKITYEATKKGNASILSKWRDTDGKMITVIYNITVTEKPKKEKPKKEKPKTVVIEDTTEIDDQKSQQDTSNITYDNTPVAKSNNTNVDVDCKHNTGNYANSIGLSAFAHKAYRENWTYVWGGKSYGQVDCAGLVAAYCPSAWSYDFLEDTKSAHYGDPLAYGLVSNGIPRIHGLGLHQPGHVGIYVANGMEVDARCTGVNMCYQPVANKPWDAWYHIQHIKYPDTGFVRIDGDVFYYEDEQYVVNCEKEINGKKYSFDIYGRCSTQPNDSEYENTTWVVY